MFKQIHSHITFSVLLLLAVLSDPGFADSLKVVQLKDGSQIRAEVISLANGIYELRSSTLGTIRIRSDQIHSIKAVQSSGQNPVQGNASISAIRSGLMNNASTMSLIMSLQSDPDMQAILADPEIMGAIQRFDFEALQNNPKIQQLMKKSQVKKIQSTLN